MKSHSAAKCQAKDPSTCPYHGSTPDAAVKRNDINAYMEARQKEEASLKKNMYDGRFQNGVLKMANNGSKSLEDPTNSKDVYSWENEERNNTYPYNMDSYVYPNREQKINELSGRTVSVNGEQYDIRRLLDDNIVPPWKAVEIFSRDSAGKAPSDADIQARVSCAVSAHSMEKTLFDSSQHKFNTLTPKRKREETYNYYADRIEKDLNSFQKSLDFMSSSEGSVPRREKETLDFYKNKINELRNKI